MARLEKGDALPSFALPTADGRTVSPQDHRGRHLIVFCYPAAMTPGCTTQACDFRDSLAGLGEQGYDVIGISPDSPDKLARFAAQEGLTYPLLADEDHAVLESLGAWGEKKNYGKTYVGVIRSTIVVGPDGTVELAKYNVRATGHVASLKKALGLA